MKDIHIGAHINTRSLVYTNPIAKYITSLRFRDVFNKKTSYLRLVNTFYGFLYIKQHYSLLYLLFIMNPIFFASKTLKQTFKADASMFLIKSETYM